MSDVIKTVALLAPVPLVHLEDGAGVCAEVGKVAFGSRAWEVFRKIDELRGSLAVDVYIYASKEPGEGYPAVSWTGRYVGHVEGVNGAHPQGMKYRPPSTAANVSDNRGHWAVFWELDRLHRLAEHERLLTHQLQGYEKRSKYKKSFVPERPLIVEHP